MERFLLLLLGWLPGVAAGWFPTDVVADGKPQRYQPLAAISQPWRLCALLPQAKDKFWWSVALGLAEEADRQGARLGIYQAGGYEFQRKQIEQFDTCLKLRADAIILASNSYSGMNQAISRAAAARIPVIDLSNGVESDEVTARVLSNTGEMASLGLQYILRHYPKPGLTLGWLPGPQDSYWVQTAEAGLFRAAKYKSVHLVHGGYASTDRSRQMKLLREVMQHRPPPDVILANAVGAEAAVRWFDAYPQQRRPVIAYYASEGVIDQLRAGRIEAAVASSPVLEARIAVDLALRALERQPHPRRVNPRISLLDHRSLEQYDQRKLLAPKGRWFIQRDLPPP